MANIHRSEFKHTGSPTQVESLVYPQVSDSYDNIQAVEQLGNVFVDQITVGAAGSHRRCLTASGQHESIADKTASEKLYLAVPVLGQIVLLYVGELTWTFGDKPMPGLDGHAMPRSASFVSSGLLDVLAMDVLTHPKAGDATVGFAFAVIYDIPIASALVRVPKNITTTKMCVLSQSWQ